MYRRYNSIGDIEITPREILTSIIIICIMLIFGINIHNAIDNACRKNAETIKKSIQIDDNTELFQHAMKTDYGNCLIYGTLETVDPIPCYEMGGEYMEVRRELQTYRDHPKTVDDYETITHEDGTTETVYVGSHIEHDWYWDIDYKDTNSCTTTMFCGVEFPFGRIYTTTLYKLGERDISIDQKYVYYGSATTCNGTLYATLSNNNLNKKKFYENKTISNVIEIAERNSNGTVWKVLFWIAWGLVIGALCYGFCYLENRWLY